MMANLLFEKNRSTSDHLVTLENEVCEAFLHKEHVGAVFFDIKKAYDRVCNEQVLNILYSIGIRGRMLIFIRNMLLDRSLQVIVGNCKSDVHNLDNGLPQGSVISVTLFLCYINDILICIEQPVFGMLYADDLTIYIKHKNIRFIENQLQKTINKLNKWSNLHGLTLSEQKSKFIFFTKTQKDYTPPSLKLNNTWTYI